MTSKSERREYRETRMTRTVSPVRHTGSAQNLSQFDNNLDNLLEDLQSSVSRPGSSLGNGYRESSRMMTTSNSSRDGSLNRVTHLSAANPTTVMSSDDVYNYTSPDGTKSIRSYKKESYSYSTSKDLQPESNRMQNNINQLDSLLDDLQQARTATLDKNRGPNYTTGIDPGLIETSKIKTTTDKRTVQRELVYDDTPRSGSLRSGRSPHRNDRENSVTRDVTYTSEGTYGDINKHARQPSPARSNTSTLNKQKTMTITNVHEYPAQVIETHDPSINAEILAQLDPNLVPTGNTKVTTTIKTYTYEIPGAGYPATASPTSDSERYVYSPNQTQSVPSNSFVYNKADAVNTSTTHSTSTLTKNIRSSPPASRVHGFKESVTLPSPESFPRNPSHTYTYNETNRTEHHPGSYPRDGWTGPGGQQPGGNKTYIYKETTTTKNLNGYPVNDNNNPPHHGHHTYIINETRHNNESPYPSGYPPHNQQQDPTHTTTVVHNRTDTNTHHNNYLPSNQPYPYNQTETFDPNNPPYNPHSGKPNDRNINITYKYSSQHNSSNKYKGGFPLNDESEALLPPQKFPTNEIDGPPKRLDDLMANIGREPPNNQFNAGYNAREAELAQQRKVDNMKTVAENAQKKDVKDLPKSKNVAGPPVYYPPGHEMFARKEEAAAWNAQGGYARESGKYKYEAESKSKSKSSSGAAIVPVCLPLCCGLPCVIL